MLNVATLLTLLTIGAIASIVTRALAGYHLAGCLVTLVLSCIGAIGGWIIQQRLGIPDNLLVLPFVADSPSVSVIGASIGAITLALFGSLLTRSPTPRRTRRRP